MESSKLLSQEDDNGSESDLERAPLLSSLPIFRSPEHSDSIGELRVVEPRPVPQGILHPSKPALRFLILFFICMTIVGSYYSYDSIAVIATELMEKLEITQAQYGLMYSVYSIPNMILPVLGGFLLDRLGVRIGLMIYLSFISVGTGLVALGPYFEGDYYWILLGRFIFGIGAESSYVAQDTMCFIWFKGRSLAMSMGFTAAAGRLSEIVAFNTMANISHWFGDFRMSLWFSAVVCLFSLSMGAIACSIDSWGERRMKKERIPRLKDLNAPDAPIVSLRDIFKLPPTFWLLCFTLSTFYATIYPFLSFASDFLQIKYHYSEEYAGRLASLLSVTSMVLAPIMGYILDRIGRRIWAVNFGNLIMIPACLLMAYTDITPIVPIMIIGLGYSFVPAAIWPSLAMIVPEHNFSTAYGTATGIANLGLVPVYYMIGKLVDESGSIEESLVLISCLSGLGVFFGFLWQIFDYRDGSPCNGTPKDNLIVEAPEDIPTDNYES